MIGGAAEVKERDAVFTRRAVSRWGPRLIAVFLAAAALYVLAGVLGFKIDVWMRLLCAVLLGSGSVFLWMALPRGTQIIMDARGLTEVYELGQRRTVIWGQVSKVEEMVKNTQDVISLDIYVERNGNPVLLIVIDRGYFRRTCTGQAVKRELRHWMPAACPWFEETYVPRWWLA